MSFKLIITGLVAAAAVLANTLPRAAFEGFEVTRYNGGCSPGGCGLGLLVSAPAGYMLRAPAFNVSCSGLYSTTEWTDCEPVEETAAPDSKVIFRSYRPSGTEFKLWVSHQFTVLGVNFNLTGSTINTPPFRSYLNFTIPVESVEIV